MWEKNPEALSKLVSTFGNILVSRFTLLQNFTCRKTVASGSSNTVCVCSYHQNVKLLCYIPRNLDYIDFMKLCVCDLTEGNCMFHLCENCFICVNGLFKTNIWWKWLWWWWHSYMQAVGIHKSGINLYPNNRLWLYTNSSWNDIIAVSPPFYQRFTCILPTWF